MPYEYSGWCDRNKRLCFVIVQADVSAYDTDLGIGGCVCLKQQQLKTGPDKVCPNYFNPCRLQKCNYAQSNGSGFLHSSICMFNSFLTA